MIGPILHGDAPVILTGAVAAGALTLGPAFRGRRAILFAQLAAGAGFAAHYALLGISVAAAVNVLGLIQTVAALRAGPSARMNRLGYALIMLMAFVGIWYWQGPISLLSVTAMSLIALARMQIDEVRLRALLIAGGGLWLVHDLAGEAWFPFAADIGALVAGTAALVSMFVRVRVEWRSRATAAPA